MNNLIKEFPDEWEEINKDSSEVVEESLNMEIKESAEIEKINPLNPCEGCKYENNLNSCYSCINFKKE